MSLRARFLVYLVLVHVVFAAGAVAALWEARAWLLGVEVFFVLSFAVGFALVRALTRPLEFAEASTTLLREADFTVRFLPTAHPEVNRLIEVYNTMADRLREERTRSEELNYFLDKLLHASPSGVLTCDFDGRIVFVNPSAERLLGLPASEILGRAPGELSVPFARELASLDEGTARILPLQGRRRIRCLKAQFVDRGFPRTYVMLDELTEELRQSEKAAYEKLIRMMSHEVNNATGAVSSLLTSALNYRGELSPENRADYEMALTVAIRRADHLNRFMKGYADVVRIPRPDPRPLDVQRLLEELVLLLGPEAARRRVRWQWEVESPLPPVQADHYGMERVFLNILRNALEAIGEDGTVTLRLGGALDRPYVCIEDTGGALSPDVQANLFQPFFSTKAQGQGLGLTLVQEILHGHAFDFSLEGTPEGTTRFTIWF